MLESLIYKLLIVYRIKYNYYKIEMIINNTKIIKRHSKDHYKNFYNENQNFVDLFNDYAKIFII